MATAILERPIVSAKILTYDDYLSEGEIDTPYEIIKGERLFMAGATPRHQQFVINLIVLFRLFCKANGGKVFTAPMDVVINRFPLQTRQPDVCVVSDERLVGLSQNLSDAKFLDVAPEIVVEVLSESDTAAVLSGKLADYRAIGVEECWLVHPQDKTVEVLLLMADADTNIDRYTDGQTVSSHCLPGLQIDTSDIFAL